MVAPLFSSTILTKQGGCQLGKQGDSGGLNARIGVLVHWFGAAGGLLPACCAMVAPSVSPAQANVVLCCPSGNVATVQRAGHQIRKLIR